MHPPHTKNVNNKLLHHPAKKRPSVRITTFIMQKERDARKSIGSGGKPWILAKYTRGRHRTNQKVLRALMGLRKYDKFPL
jgi:hypothetical protein